MPTRRGFGSSMIEGAVNGQLDGAVELHWLPEGLACRMNIPRRRLLDDAEGPELIDHPRSSASDQGAACRGDLCRIRGSDPHTQKVAPIGDSIDRKSVGKGNRVTVRVDLGGR